MPLTFEIGSMFFLNTCLIPHDVDYYRNEAKTSIDMMS